MSNILTLRFLDVPGTTNSIYFDYWTQSGSTQSVEISYVSGEDERTAAGKFVIATTSVADNYEYFGKYFINDFDISENIFIRTDYPGTNQYDFQVDGGTISNLSINNWNTTFTYSLSSTASYAESISTRITYTFNSNPSAGDTLNFTYYSGYPSFTSEDVITLSFTGSTPSAIGEVLIGADVNETTENLEIYFNQWYNYNEQFNTELDTSGTTYSLAIWATNNSTLTAATSSGSFIEIAQDQTPTDIVVSPVLVRSSKFYYGPSSTDVVIGRVSVYLPNNPSDNNTLQIILKRNGVSFLSIWKRFHSTQGTIPDEFWVDIGATAADTMDNLLLSLQTYNPGYTGITAYSINGAGTWLYIDNIIDQGDVIDYTATFNVSGMTVQGPIYNEYDYSFDSTTFNVYKWEGHLSDDEPSTADYTITKQVISPDQTRLYLDFSRLVQHDFRSYMASYVSTSNVQNAPAKMLKWIKVSASNKLIGVETDYRENYFYALNGWSSTPSHSVPRVLLAGESDGVVKRYYHKDSVKRIFYKTDQHFGYSVITGTDGSYVMTNMNGDINKSTEFIRSAKIPTVDNSSEYLGNKITFPFNYYDGNDTNVIVEYYDNCKYPLVDIVFKNRYGVLETLSCGLLSRRNLETEREGFVKGIVNINGTIDRTLHSRFAHNINADEVWTLNTGLIPEYMNVAIEDMFLSDEIYLVDEYSDDISGQEQTAYRGFNFIPVTLEDSNFNRLRGYSDGPSNYTFKFKTSHQKIFKVS